jgi:hypothetical protein
MKIDQLLNLVNKFADHVQAQPGVFYQNYDYGQQTKSEKENTKLGPGTGFYSNMDKYKSVKDFVNSDRKMKRKKRKKKLAFLILAEKLKLDLSGIPKDTIHDGYDEGEIISKDNTINGIPFTNRIDPFPTYDSSLAAPVGYMFDNDVMHNSYEGILSLQGSEMKKTLKLAELYYKLATIAFTKDDWLPKSFNFDQIVIDEDESSNRSITVSDFNNFATLFGTLQSYGLIKPINGGLYFADWVKIVNWFNQRSYGQWKKCNQDKLDPEIIQAKLNYFNVTSRSYGQIMAIKDVLSASGTKNINSFVLTPERIQNYLKIHGLA